jgi:hypothetical protein
MLRYIFRGLVAITLLVMYIERTTGGKMGPYAFLLFGYWFIVTIVLFSAFGIYSVVRAIRDPRNRRAYLLDILISASWVPYWLTMLR